MFSRDITQSNWLISKFKWTDGDVITRLIKKSCKETTVQVKRFGSSSLISNQRCLCEDFGVRGLHYYQWVCLKF